MIPALLHQIWHPVHAPSLPREWSRFAEGWRRHHPEHRHVLWTAEESRRFVADRHPATLAAYDAAPPLARIAVLKFLILEHFGGVYADLDLECLRSFEPILAGQRLVIAEEVRELAQAASPGEPILSTAFLAAEPGHPFLQEVIRQLGGVQEPARARAVLSSCHARAPGRLGRTILPAEALHPVPTHDPSRGLDDVVRWVEATGRAYGIHHRSARWWGERREPARRPRAFPGGVPIRLRHPHASDPSWAALYEDGPLVTCLLSSDGRVEPARWAIDCFREQTYGNRELRITCTGPDDALRRHVASLADPRIRFAGDRTPDAGAELPGTRFDPDGGEYLCVWRAEDLHAPDRLSLQMTAALSAGVPAALAERICCWVPAEDRLVVTAARPAGRTLVVHRRALDDRTRATLERDPEAAAEAVLARHPAALLDAPSLCVQVIVDPAPRERQGAVFADPALDARGPDHERALSLLQKHVPILEVREWLARGAPDASASPAPARSHDGRTAPLRVLLASEVRAGFGHVVLLGQLARALRARGHEVHLAVPDLSCMRAGLGGPEALRGLSLWPAPYWALGLRGAESGCHAELLFRDGFLDAQRLAGLVEGWDTLYRQVRPELLVVSHAPTALLAARAHRFPRAAVGTGFHLPPPGPLLPSFPEPARIPDERLREAEARALATCNAIARERGLGALRSLAELFAGDAEWWVTVPELDPLGPRTSSPRAHYVGALPTPLLGAPPRWPEGDGPAVLAYLAAERPETERVLRTLRAGPWRVLAFVAGGSASERVAGGGLTITGAPIDLGAALPDCAAVVCHGGPGTVLHALHAGKPVLLLPGSIEQLLVARRAVAMGAGAALLGEAVEGAPTALRELLESGRHRAAAEAFAARHAGRRDPAEEIADGCEELARAVSVV